MEKEWEESPVRHGSTHCTMCACAACACQLAEVRIIWPDLNCLTYLSIHPTSSPSSSAFTISPSGVRALQQCCILPLIPPVGSSERPCLGRVWKAPPPCPAQQSWPANHCHGGAAHPKGDSETCIPRILEWGTCTVHAFRASGCSMFPCSMLGMHALLILIAVHQGWLDSCTPHRLVLSVDALCRV